MNIETPEQLEAAWSIFMEQVQHGYVIPIWGRENMPVFIPLHLWEGRGVELTDEELEEMYHYMRMVINTRWN